MLDDGAGAFGLGLGLHLRHWGFHSTLKRFRLVLYTEGEGRRELLRQWVSVPRKRGEPLQWWNVKRYARRGIMPHITLEEESGLPSYKDKKDSVNRTLHSQYRGSITETSITILITIYTCIYTYIRVYPAEKFNAEEGTNSSIQFPFAPSSVQSTQYGTARVRDCSYNRRVKSMTDSFTISLSLTLVVLLYTNQSRLQVTRNNEI